MNTSPKIIILCVAEAIVILGLTVAFVLDYIDIWPLVVAIIVLGNITAFGVLYLSKANTPEKSLEDQERPLLDQ